MGDLQHLESLPTALYRFYDAEDRLLYIGITRNPEKRFPQHAVYESWWPTAVRHTIEWFPSRAPARDAETLAIRTEDPLCNRQTPRNRHRPSAYVAPPLVTPEEAAEKRVTSHLHRLVRTLEDRDLAALHRALGEHLDANPA